MALVPPMTPRRLEPGNLGLAAQDLLARGLPSSDVIEVALSPRPMTGSSKPMTPRPVVRGPPQDVEERLLVKELSKEEEDALMQAFKRHDKHDCGKLELHSFHELCHSLDLHLDAHVARNWLGDLNQVAEDGFTIEDVKGVYQGMLSAQTPAVRKSAGGHELKLTDLRATEDYMRGAFKKFAPGGTVGPDGLRNLLKSLGFPDVHGDLFDRFVGEWLLLAGKPDADQEPPLNVHDFISCVNLLVDLCRDHQLQEELKLSD